MAGHHQQSGNMAQIVTGVLLALAFTSFSTLPDAAGSPVLDVLDRGPWLLFDLLEALLSVSHSPLTTYLLENTGQLLHLTHLTQFVGPLCHLLRSLCV